MAASVIFHQVRRMNSVACVILGAAEDLASPPWATAPTQARPHFVKINEFLSPGVKYSGGETSAISKEAGVVLEASQEGTLDLNTAITLRPDHSPAV